MKKLNSLLLLSIGLVFFSCKSAEIEPVKQHTLIFSDDFSGTVLSKKWQRGVGEGGKGKWVVENNSLNIQNAKNDPLWLDVPLPKNFRIEFEAQALSTDGDIKVEVLGDGKNHASGYVIIFGGWKNKLDVIARLDEHGKDRKEQPTLKVVKGKVYNVTISRSDQRLVWSIDGKEHMSYLDKNPLGGNLHSKFAFSNWTAPLRFSKLRIYKI